MSKLNKRLFGVDIRNFVKGRKICSGGFGEVFLTQYLSNGEYYAAKVLKRDPSKPQTQKLIENEVKIMMNINHPTIIKFLGYSLLDFNLTNNVTIFMELAKNHSLDSILERIQKSENPKGYDNTTRQIILIGVACGMKYLHSNSIVHRDLKSNNILLDSNYHPLITDFGTAKYFNKKHAYEQPQQICGTLPYMAPEVITGSKYNQKIDVYSFGILMYEVITNNEPYPHLEKRDSVINEFKNRVVKFNYRPEFKVQVKSELKSLIQKCWAYSPSERPTFDELFEKLKSVDYFLDNVDAKKIQNYVNFITKKEAETKQTSKENEIKNFSNNSIELDQLKKLNDQLKLDNEQLKEQINSLKEENKQLTTNYQQLSKKFEAVVKKLLVYENEEPEFQENSASRPSTSVPSNLQEESTTRPVIILPPNDKKEEELNPRKRSFPPPRNPTSPRSFSPPRNSSPRDEYHGARTPQRPIQMMNKRDEKQFIRAPPRPATSRDKRDDIFMRSQIIKDKKDENSFFRSSSRRSPNQSGEKREDDLFARSQIIKDKKDDEINIKNPMKVVAQSTDKQEDDLFARSQIIRDKREDDKKLPPLRKTKSDESSVKSLSLIISVAEFNSYPLHLQRSFVSKINANSRGNANQFFKNLDSLLIYLLQFVNSTEASNYVEIQAESPDTTLDNIKESNCVNLLSNATEILYFNKTLDSEEFLNILYLFENASIEIKYLSKFYMGSYRIISQIASEQIKTNIFISGVKRTDNTFKENNLINSVKLDFSVTSIGDYAFKGCSSLTNIVIPSSVTSIGSGSFEGCTSLVEISIPSSVPSIGIGLFKGCSSLEKISLLHSIKLIRSNAFFGCSSLNQITIPSSVTSIGDHAFEGCSSLNQILIPSSVISIGEFAFCKCNALTEISVPFSVLSIGKNAFEKCSALEEISLPSSLENIKELGLLSHVRITLV